MLFQSWSFALFFAVVYPVYLAVRRTRLRLPYLLLISYFFYACFNPIYVVLIAYATCIDYVAVRQMSRTTSRKVWLIVSIANNLGLLAFFKYAGFLVDNVNSLLSVLRVPPAVGRPPFLLPVGLSFYVFQSLAYSIDVYRGAVERERGFLAHATFVAFFPRLLAGPIERASDLMPQVRRDPGLGVADFTGGLSLFVVGLFKKVALADYFALYVNQVYADPGGHQSAALLLATFLFSWQIYFDFSGYTDMARGLARAMGYRLSLNFRNPYLASSLGEFWQRWHISLSSWFKDYVYIPLGGNRHGRFKTYRNIFLTMVLSGLWHGAAWTFVLWGAVHALGRFATREFERSVLYRERIPTLAKQLFVFGFVTLAWIFFRAETMGEAWTVLTRILVGGWADPRCPLLALGVVLLLWATQLLYESRYRRLLVRPSVRVAAVTAMIVYLIVFVRAGQQPFIYLQF